MRLHASAKRVGPMISLYRDWRFRFDETIGETFSHFLGFRYDEAIDLTLSGGSG